MVGRALLSCAHPDWECAIGLILGKLTVSAGVGALMICAHQDQECAIGLILGKITVYTEEVGALMS